MTLKTVGAAWIDDELRESMVKSDEAKKAFSKTDNKEDWQTYRRAEKSDDQNQ